jgi:hypothetical protein
MIIKAGGPGSESKRLAAASTAAFQRAAEADSPQAAQAAVAEALDKAGDAKLAAAYTYLQRAVGVLAVLLVPVLVVGHRLSDHEWIRDSISSYYYTHMGNVFVGVLAALAVFFLSYNYRPLRDFELDSMLSKFASLVAAGVAVFPTASAIATDSSGARWVSRLHLVCAGTLFVLLGVFARFRFTKTGGRATTPEKRRRNRVYTICGTMIFAAIGVILLLVTNVINPPDSWHLFFWLETICVEAFGCSWLVKGGIFGFMADKEPVPA